VQCVHYNKKQYNRNHYIYIYRIQTNVNKDLIETIFLDHVIPVFIDQKLTMLKHSLIEFIRSSLEVVEGNWRYDAIFRVLKTGFIQFFDTKFPITNDTIDVMDNYDLE